MKRLLGRLGPIGIDLGGRWMNAAQLRRGPGGVELAAATRVRRLNPGPGRPDAADLARLAATLDRRGFVGRRAVVGAPDDRLFVSVLQLPAAAPGVPLEEIARDELAREHRKDPGQISSGWWKLPAPEKAEPGTSAMAVGLSHADAEALLDALEAAGVEVVRIDAAALALSRAAAVLEPRGASVVIDAGWNAATIVLASQGLPIFQRRLTDPGAAALHLQAKDLFDTDEQGADAVLADPTSPGAGEDVVRLVEAAALALAREVSAALTYVAHRFPGVAPACISTVGDGALIGGLGARVAAACELREAPMTPATLARVPAGLAEWSGAGPLAAAIALADESARAGANAA
jgi:Tfp pilus assembly PilM family ATPase